MKDHRLYYYLLIITCSLIAFVLLFNYFKINWVSIYVWYIIGYMLAITCLTGIVALKGLRKDMYTFQNYYMGMMGIRLLLTGGFIFIYFYCNFTKEKKETYLFLGNFFAIYMIYTVTEIYYLIKKIKST